MKTVTNTIDLNAPPKFWKEQHDTRDNLMPPPMTPGEAASILTDTIKRAEAERDRLRDLVRRLADSLQGIIDAADGKGEGVLDEALLREARAAIGEDKP